MEHTADEIKNLKACINDLISVLALPAIWTGREPSQIISTLLDDWITIPDEALNPMETYPFRKRNPEEEN